MEGVKGIKKFEKLVAFRLFNEEYVKIEKIIKYAKDFDSGRKYSNFSHFCRCAVIQLMIKEFDKIRGYDTIEFIEKYGKERMDKLLEKGDIFEAKGKLRGRND